MARLGSLLIKGAGGLLLAFIALSVIATIVGIVLSIVATVVTAVVALSVLAVVVLAVVGLVSILRDDAADIETEYGDLTGRSGERDTEDPKDRLRSKYVTGELSDAEFEQELDRVLEDDDLGRATGLDGDGRSRQSTSDRSRLWDR